MSCLSYDQPVHSPCQVGTGGRWRPLRPASAARRQQGAVWRSSLTSQGAVWRSSLWALLSPWRACAGAPDITLFYEENNNQVSSIFAARNWGSRRLGTIRTGQITAATEPVNTVAEQDKTVKVVGVSSWKWDECLPAFFLLPFSLPLSLSPSPP